MIARHGFFFLSCLVAFTAGHMFNYAIILWLQESVGSDLLSGVGFALAFGSSIVFGWFAGVLCDRVAPGKIFVDGDDVHAFTAQCIQVCRRDARERLSFSGHHLGNGTAMQNKSAQ